MISKNNKIK